MKFMTTRGKEWTNLEPKIFPLSMEWVDRMLLYNTVFHTDTRDHYL